MRDRVIAKAVPKVLLAWNRNAPRTPLWTRRCGGVREVVHQPPKLKEPVGYPGVQIVTPVRTPPGLALQPTSSPTIALTGCKSRGATLEELGWGYFWREWE